MKKKIISLIMTLAMVVSMIPASLGLFAQTAFAADGTLVAGAGAAPIKFDAAMFPVEGFSGKVDTDPYLRVLLIEDGTKVAIVSAEMVNISADVISAIQNLVHEEAGIPVENVWVHANHTITTMHAPKEGAELYEKAMLDAAAAAVKDAITSKQPAVLGVGKGESEVNANRNKLYPDGKYHVGNGGEEDEARGIISNHTMTVIRFDGADGKPIGMIMSHGTKPTAIDNAEMSENTRLLSSDVPGKAVVMMEEKYGCPVMFVMGASGDQIPKETTNYFEPDESGEYKSKFGTVAEGLGYVEKYGTQMGNDAIKIADSITCDQDSATVVTTSLDYTVRNNKDDGDVDLTVNGIAIGDDLAFVGLKPEIDSITELQVWEASPYKNTIVASFTNGDQKYMAHKEGFDEPKTVEAQKSGFEVGAAETFVDKAKTVLDELKNLQVTSIKAGAGAAPIKFDAAMFPVEGFSGEVDTDPYLRVLLIEDGGKAAIVSAEMVNISADVITSIREVIHEEAGVPISNIWVHANHTITTMHAPKENTDLYNKAMMDATVAALKDAMASFQPAVLGIGRGESDVNANRNKLYPDGKYHVGNGGEEDEARGIISNHVMTVIRFDSLDGKPIGMIMSHGTKPTAIDNAEMQENTRLLSSDVPGKAVVMMEEEFGCPCMFVMGASGDQIPKETTNYFEPDESGEYKSKFGTVKEGLGYVEKYGTQMGNDAIAIAKEISADTTYAEVSTLSRDLTVRNNKDDGDVTVDVNGLAFGDDLAFIGIKPEIDSATELQLWNASPYTTTIVASFTNGDQKYMAHKEGFDEPKTVEAQKSGFEVGAAEKLVGEATDILKELKDGKGTRGNNGDEDAANDTKYEVVTFGGIEWYVLDTVEGQSLLLAKDVLESRVYDSAEGGATWENSEIRAYLNGDFITNTFTKAEAAKIIEVANANPSSAYGISGGNDTQDKVFLLSTDEANKYIKGNEIAVASLDGTPVWWSLRSPGEAKDVQTGVTEKGLIDLHGTHDGMDGEAGIRPALWTEIADTGAIRNVTPLLEEKDGKKTYALAVEYNEELATRDVPLTAEDFEVVAYETINSDVSKPLTISKVYLNTEAKTAATGETRGTFVIIELTPDEKTGSIIAANVGVKQLKDLTNISGNAVKPGADYFVGPGWSIDGLFTDVTDPSLPYYKPVYWAAKNGIIKGFDDGTFGPEKTCTREQFVIMIWRYAGKPVAESEVKFSDITPDRSSYKAIQWAVENDIIRGFDDGTFKPEGTTTRRQVAIMLWRMNGRQTATGEVKFSDVDKSESTYKAIQWGVEAGMIKGYEDGTFKPEDDCLRMHIAIMLYRYARDVDGVDVSI